MVKKMVRVLVMSGVFAVFTTAPHAQDAEHGSLRESHRDQKSIAGSWMGTIDNGQRILMSFTSDGIAFSTFQSEVNLTRPVLTPAQGAWTHLGGRQFALTTVGILYDIQTGAYQGSVRVRAVLTLARSGDRIDATVKVESFSPDGTLVAAFPHTLRFTRVKVALLD